MYNFLICFILTNTQTVQ